MPDPSQPYDYENDLWLSEEQKKVYRERDRKMREFLEKWIEPTPTREGRRS
jgi:hypothetical protein